MKKVFIIEDDDVVREELTKVLKKNNYEVETTTDFSNAYESILASSPNLILMDINLPKTNGFELCQKLRKKIKTPIIFVTSRSSDIDELKSITLGGDDFITKPYNISVLLARISAVLKRSNPDNNNELVIKGVKLNLYLSSIEYEDKVVDLTKNEFRILYYLFINAGKIVTKDEIIEYLWTNKMYVDENILNVNMTRIRKKLSEIGVKDFPQTIHGKGYQI